MTSCGESVEFMLKFHALFQQGSLKTDECETDIWLHLDRGRSKLCSINQLPNRGFNSLSLHLTLSYGKSG